MDKVYIGPLSKGLERFLLPFNINNDAFPTLMNFYAWRGRARRKRGTVTVGRLQRKIDMEVSPNVWQIAAITLIGGAGTLLNPVVPGSINIVVSADQTYTDPNRDGTLTGSSGGTGTINYSTGAFTVSGSVTGTVTGTFNYYPDLPVLGLVDYTSTSSQYPLLVAFDQKYAYQIDNSSNFYSVSYYKGSNAPVVWHGQDWQQFWGTNYQGALWVTNNNPGMIFELVAALDGITVGSPTTTITTDTPHGLVTGDYVFFIEFTGDDAGLINGKSFQITVPAMSTDTFTIVLDTSMKVINNDGFFQILTNNPNVVANTGALRDGIKWYDGMTGTTGLPVDATFGWVNFSPPLSAGTVIIDDNGPNHYYLVGASAIIPFKDHLIFLSPWIQNRNDPPIHLQDVAIYSWNGTPYYAAPAPVNQGFDIRAYYVSPPGFGGWRSAGIDEQLTTVANNDDVLIIGFTQAQARFTFNGNQLDPFDFYVINSELGSASTFSGISLDKGVLALGLNGLTLTTQDTCGRIDISIPDEVFQIKGPQNVHAVERISSARDYFHEWVYFTFVPNTSQWRYPTLTFQFNYRENNWSFNYENFTAHGQYRKQTGYTWATIPFRTWATWRESWDSATTTALFPSVVAGNPQGFVVVKGKGTGEAPTGYISDITNDAGFTQITSHDHCVAINDYIYFSQALGTTIATITGITKANPAVITAVNIFIAGQVIFISEVVGMTEINGRFVTIISATSSAITIQADTSQYTTYTSGGRATISPLGMQIGKVARIANADMFTVDIPYVNLGYIGLGVFTRLSQPLLQTKQFAPYWNEGRQVRVGVQKYLMENTANGQCTVNIYLNQDPDTVFNFGNILPSEDVTNNSLEYSQILYTCPESTNLGLSPANITETKTNLQSPRYEVSVNQYQMWHRINTSLQGESFQLGITLSDEQMRYLNQATNEITVNAMQIDIFKGPTVS